MQNYSTLLYFVNNFRNDIEASEFDMASRGDGDSITKMDFEPSERSIKNILSFARSYEVLETDSAGYVEMNLN